MGITSNIEWTDATWNPWQGCTKVSPACTHCYMFRDMPRYGKDPAVVRRSAEGTFTLPLHKNREREYKIAPGSKVFTCSWSDWFHEAADPWRDEAWAIIRKRPDVTFQIVTKRTERIAQCLPADWGDGYPNVILIATVENQEWAEKRIPELLAVPANRGLSIEPLLGPIDLLKIRYEGMPLSVRFGGVSAFSMFFKWVIVGGESGPKSRPMKPEWVRFLKDQCVAHGVAFFFKQWGEWAPWDFDSWNVGDYEELVWSPHDPETEVSYRVGTKLAGRSLDCREWSEFPKLGAV